MIHHFQKETGKKTVQLNENFQCHKKESGHILCIL